MMIAYAPTEETATDYPATIMADDSKLPYAKVEGRITVLYENKWYLCTPNLSATDIVSATVNLSPPYKTIIIQVFELIEDDCKSIGGLKECCITDVEEIKTDIRSIIVPEFAGIDSIIIDC